MTTNESNADNGSVSIGDIVRSPDGTEWVVIDPCNLSGDLPTNDYHWLGNVHGDDSRGIGKETFHTDGWEVLG